MTERSPKFERVVDGEQSLQFKQLLEIAAKEQAVRICNFIKGLGTGEFADSKLRDKNGELMILWHGSPRKFETFDENAEGEFRWRNTGIHFSSSREVIEQYADKAFSALRQILYDIFEKLNPGQKLDQAKLDEAKKAFNRMVEDLIVNGENSSFYKKGFGYGENSQRRPNLDALTFEGRLFGTEWSLEIFNGQMPTNENTYFDAKEGVYLGKDIGKYEYAAVVNTKNPFETNSTNMDFDFEQGEKSHLEQGTDATVLFHKDAVVGNGMQAVEQTKGTYSIAIYDTKNIKIIGRKEGAKFVTLLNFSSENIVSGGGE